MDNNWRYSSSDVFGYDKDIQYRVEYKHATENFYCICVGTDNGEQYEFYNGGKIVAKISKKCLEIKDVIPPLLYAEISRMKENLFRDLEEVIGELSIEL